MKSLCTLMPYPLTAPISRATLSRLNLPRRSKGCAMHKGVILVVGLVLLCLTSTSGLASDAIESKYQEMGGLTGPLGAPVTPEYINPDGVGRRQHYERASIYWTPVRNAGAALRRRD